MEKVKQIGAIFDDPTPPPDAGDAEPETWVSIQNYIFDGVRKQKVEEYANYFIRLEESIPLPPEAKISLYEALAQVFSVNSENSLVRRRLRETLVEYRNMLKNGAISKETFAELRLSMENIQLKYTQMTDETIHWFLDNYFRVFKEIEADPKKVAALVKRQMGLQHAVQEDDQDMQIFDPYLSKFS